MLREQTMGRHVGRHAMLLGLLAVVAVTLPARAQTLTATAIVARAQEAFLGAGDDMRAHLTMRLINKGGKERLREMTMLRTDLEDGDQKYFIYFHRPGDVRDMTFMVWKYRGRDDDRGFVQANYLLRVADPAPGDPADDFLLGDHRVRLELGRSSSSGGVRFGTKVDLVHDALVGEAGLDLREAHVTFEGGRYDVTLGRQILTSGVGDLVFVNDLFTKDWTALVAGQPLQYLKVGSDAVNTNLYPGPVSVQVVAVPFFEPDLLPRGDRLVGYTPFPGLPEVDAGPDRTLGNTEVAARVYGYLGGFDVAGYVYRGF